MPQATQDLQDDWEDDCAALDQLEGNFKVSRASMISCYDCYIPTEEDWSAINYLCQEWGYGYEEVQ